MRILGLDVGSRTTGVALQPSLLLTAQGMETQSGNRKRKILPASKEIIKEKRCTSIFVVGKNHVI